MNTRSAVSRINQRGALLVFPLNNQKEPRSLWSEFFPRKRMVWKWDESGDNRVGDMWSLMKKLSEGRQVIYSKWYRGRATFFARDLFRAMLKVSGVVEKKPPNFSTVSQNILSVLEGNSPISTRELKIETDLVGRWNETVYNRNLKFLFMNLLVVGFGEVDDGAFPSLAIGATQLLYEDLWQEARALASTEAQETLDAYMPVGSLFRKFFENIRQG